MNSKVNYTMVGGIVLALIAGCIAFVYWMLMPSDEEVMKPYRIYFTESVSGLNIDAPVKYRGVTVGKVRHMQINPLNSEEVDILVSIGENTPIKTDTVAKLTSQGVTGLSYIDLSQGSQKAPPLKAKQDDIPVIPSVPSFFERFEKSMDTVSTRLSKTLLRTEQVLSDENQAEIAKMLQHTASTMQRIDRLLDDESIAHFHAFMANADAISAKLDRLLPKAELLVENTVVWEESIKHSFASIMGSYKQIEGSMVRFKQSVEEGDINIKEIAGPSLANIDNTMVQIQETLVRLELLIERMERSPSDVLFRRETIHEGPGE